MDKTDRINILGVEVSLLSKNEILELVEAWIDDETSDKKYIVTTNVEFILDAQKDNEFREILNNADLSIPDSTRLGWAAQMVITKNFVRKLGILMGFLVPKKFSDTVLTIRGVDLMESLVSLANNKAFTVGFLGGQNMVAKKLSERLEKKYENLKIIFAESGPKVNKKGDEIDGTKVNIPKVDILFVAFGHIKQEKWIAKNLDKIPVKVAMGVGGSFDYLSGGVIRAPGFIRALGYEWLFRLITQPWRIRRQIRLIKFVWMLFWAA